MVLSDHNPVFITLTLPTTHGRSNIWRLDNSLLTDLVHIQQITRSLTHYFAENTTEDTSPISVWAAHKCVIRGKFISLAAQRNKLRKARINELTDRILTLEQAHKASLAASTLTELTQTREELLEELNHTLKRNYAMTQKLFYEFGNKSGKLLARALQVKKAAHTIHKITTPTGDTLVTTDDISDHFVQYFSKLYNLPTTLPPAATSDRMTAITDFLAQYCPSPLSSDESSDLDLPLSGEEILTALKQMKPGKSPGPDGLTVSYYKSFPGTLVPHLTKAFNNLSPTSNTMRDILEAHVTLIPKQGKDPSLVSNYCPISLLNVDLKLYAKVLANRILPLLPKLISLDQVGFVPGREARDNTIKALNIHHWLSKTSTKGFFLSLDEEKAFDRVAWDYMEATLRVMGFPSHLLQMILALYSAPTAKLRINGRLSNAFSVSNGTRQGCPPIPAHIHPYYGTNAPQIKRQPGRQRH